MNTNMSDKLAHFTFTCKHYPEMLNFYGNTLGLKLQFKLPYHQGAIDAFREMGYEIDAKEGDEWITYFKVADRQFIELFNMSYKGDNDQTKQPLAYVCLWVTDIGEAALDLQAKGVRIWNGPSYEKKPASIPFNDKISDDTGAKSFFITDPEGNEIKIVQFTENSMQITQDYD